MHVIRTLEYTGNNKKPKNDITIFAWADNTGGGIKYSFQTRISSTFYLKSLKINQNPSGINQFLEGFSERHSFL